MQAAERTRAWRTGARPEAYAAILSSGTLRRAAAERGDARRAFDPLAGVWQALTEAHLPLVAVDEEALTAGDAGGAAVLVQPDVGELPDRLVDIVGRLVHDGLGLVATYRSGLGGLSGLLGIRSAGYGHRAGRIGTEAIGGSELVNYLSFAPGHPITEDVARSPGSYAGGYLRLLEADGTVLGHIHDPDHAAMDGERWFGWYPGPAASPLGVARQVGRGRVVFWAAPFDTAFYRVGRPAYGTLLARSCSWAAGRMPELRVEAPVSVEVRSWIGQRGRTIVLANRTTNDLYAIGTGVAVGAATSSAAGAGTGQSTLRAQQPRVVIPVADVVLRMPWREAAAPAVETLSGREAAIAVVDGSLEVKVPRLEAYEVVYVPD
jgi:hypothetical protein